MRVLELGKYYFPVMGGIEQHVTYLSRGLSNSQDVRVVTSNDSASTTLEMDGQVIVMRCGRIVEAFSTPLCPSMHKAIRLVKPEVVHIHLPNPMAHLALNLSGVACPIVVTYHADITGFGALRTLYSGSVRTLLEKADAILTTSPNLLTSSELLREVHDKAEVVPYGIDPSQFSLRPGDEIAVETLKAKYPAPLVLFVGRLVPYKGVEYLVEAASRTGGTFLIVGAGRRRGVSRNSPRVTAYKTGFSS